MFARALLFACLLSLNSCSLLFGFLSTRDCNAEENPDVCEGDISVVCRGGNLFRIDCDEAGNDCDPSTGECRIGCGNGFVEENEECDHLFDEDCNLACRAIPHCGNTAIESPESCDDGNLISGDGCSDHCLLELVNERLFVNEPQTSDLGPESGFGNDFNPNFSSGPLTRSALFAGEMLDGDEDMYELHNPTANAVPIRIVPAPIEGFLGDGCLDANLQINVREFDGAEVANAVTRDEACNIVSFSLQPQQTLYLHLAKTPKLDGFVPFFIEYVLFIQFDTVQGSCGDGALDPLFEECELTSALFCNDFCQRIPICGDNFVDSGESCDDGNGINGDGCDEACVLEGAVLEVEPNQELPIEVDVVDGERPFEGNDFDSSAAQGPFTEDVVLVAEFSQLGDEDIFSLRNDSDAPRQVQIEVSLAVFGLGQRCLLSSLFSHSLNSALTGSMIDPVLNIRDSERKRTQLSNDQTLSHANGQLDVCPRVSTTIPPQSEVFVHLVSFGGNFAAGVKYVVSINFPECGDGVIEADEECETPGSNGCDEQCQRVAICGDGIVDVPEEQCDDGDIVSDEACPSNCLFPGALFETEPNHEGEPLPDFSSNQSLGTDFSVENVGPAFTSDQIISGVISPSGDEDIFSIRNDDARVVSVRLNTFDPARGLGVSCGGFVENTVDTAIVIKKENGFLFSDGVATNGLPSLNRDRDPNSDFCSGFELILSPGETIFVTVMSDFDTTETAPYLLLIDFADCGDNQLESREECDPPNGLTCDEQCQRVPVCDDGFLDAPEVCEDGNALDGDGCSSLCAIEPGFFCEGSPSACTAVTCGDGLLEFPEFCDDGNVTNGDTCSANCSPFQFATEVEPNDDGSPSTGGFNQGNDFSSANANGPFTENTLIFASVEPVGDEDVFAIQNTGSSNATVRVDTYDPSFGIGAPCIPFQGNNVDTSMVLREANGDLLRVNDDRDIDNDSCSGLDILLAPGQIVFVQILRVDEFFVIDQYLVQISFVRDDCGDGILLLSEQCDDGNVSNGDGCASDCRVESCGDNQLAGAEQCDDGNSINGDGCDSLCQSEAFTFTCPTNQTLFSLSPFDLPQAIPDSGQGFAQSFIATNDNRVVRSVFVRINELLHTSGGDLQLFLQFPSGGVVDLSNNRGGNGNNFINTDFADACVTPIGSGVAPFTGCFRPEGPLSALTGNPAFGNWILFAVDSISGDVGVLNSWVLNLCVDSFLQGSCGDGIVSAAEQCDDANNINTDACPNNCQNASCGDSFVRSGVEQCDDGNTSNGDGCDSVCQVEVATFTCDADQTLLQFLPPDLPQAILDVNQGFVQSRITLNDNRIVKKVSVRIDELLHTFDGDLRVFLEFPSGGTVELSTNRGNSGDNFIDTDFADTCGAPIASGAAPFTGCFRPESPLSDLTGNQVFGNWSLFVLDTVNGDVGVLNAWTLSLCVQ